MGLYDGVYTTTRAITEGAFHVLGPIALRTSPYYSEAFWLSEHVWQRRLVVLGYRLSTIGGSVKDSLRMSQDVEEKQAYLLGAVM